LLLLSTGCPDEIRQRQLAKQHKHRKQLQQLQQSVRQCKRELAVVRRQTQAARRGPPLPPPLPCSAFEEPASSAKAARRWSARHIPIVSIPAQPGQGEKPTDQAKRRFIRNKFWRYMRIRRKRIKLGLSKRLCRSRRRYLRKHPSDPQAVLTVALCRANHHFQGKLYFQVDFGGAIVIHRKQWHRDDIRRFLSRYRALVNKARSLGFFRLIFVGEGDLKRRQRRLDFKHKWYGHQVSFKPGR